MSSNLNGLKVFPGGSEVKASARNAGELGSIPGLGRSPGEGNGNPLQYSCLENPMDGGAWWATVHGVAKSRTQLSDFTSGWAEACRLQPTAQKRDREELPHARGQRLWPRGATPVQGAGGCVGTGGLRGATPRSRSGGPAMRRYPSSKVRSGSCALLEHL